MTSTSFKWELMFYCFILPTWNKVFLFYLLLLIHRSPVNSPHKGQWRGALMFSLICARINGWVTKCEAGDFWTQSCSLWRNCNEPLRSSVGLDNKHIKIYPIEKDIRFSTISFQFRIGILTRFFDLVPVELHREARALTTNSDNRI